VSGEFLGLAYNVAGLPEGISGSHPATNTPIISPLLNAYDLVLVQESWQTPDPNPLAPLRVYHELLVADATHAYKSIPAPQPNFSDPERPSAILSDGVNRLSRFPFATEMRVRWPGCHNSAADCLAIKGFTVARTTFAPGVEIDVYNLHMEAGGDPQDEVLRDAGVSLLRDTMNGYSAGRAVIIGGDFNLHTDEPVDGAQYARLLAEAGLTDVCAALSCPSPGRIDKFAFRSGGGVALAPESWRFETDVFQDPQGEPLSDHDALAVRWTWTATAP
jgi:endonuclease/exonuclease/phosphatase family metal-dependent hydrolase